MQGTLFPAAATPAARPSRRSARASAASAPATRRSTPICGLLKRHELVFAEGPAGTGKTWLAVGHAVQLLEQGAVERLVLSRPAVEAGERLGFLPGDMKEKVDPYLRPIYDALYDFMEARHVERGLQTGMIEIAPLAFMRGRTLTNAIVLLDEAQNTTTMQMKMFLTRLGEGSRMIVTGDPSQIDLPPGQKSGLVEAVRILDGVEGIGRVTFARGRRGAPRSRAPHRRRLRGRRCASLESQDVRPMQAPVTRGCIALDIAVDSRRWDALAGCARGDRGARARGGRRPGRRARCRTGAELSLLLTDDAADARASTASGAARTSRPTCSPSRPSSPAELAQRAVSRRYRRRLRDAWRARRARRGQAPGRPLRASRGARLPPSARPRPRDATRRPSAWKRWRSRSWPTLGIADPYRSLGDGRLALRRSPILTTGPRRDRRMSGRMIFNR